MCATVCHTHLPFCSPFSEISSFLGAWGMGRRQFMCGCQITILLPAILGMPLKILLLAFSLNSQQNSFCQQTCCSSSNIATTKAATLIRSVKLKCSALKLNPACSHACRAVDLEYHGPKLRYSPQFCSCK